MKVQRRPSALLRVANRRRCPFIDDDSVSEIDEVGASCEFCSELSTFAWRLKTLRDLTHYEHICKLWTEQPQRFKLDPIHHMTRLNI